MLRRKIESVLQDWKNKPSRKPLVIKGVRQCGKTFSVRKFAGENYANVIYIDFFEQPDAKVAFQGSKKVDDIVMNLTAIVPGATFVPGQTCLILDELQECPEARTALKFFKTDGRYDIICTGSLLGVSGYGSKDKKKDKEKDKEKGTSVPVGYETIVEMNPLDFEEFLWADGITPQIIDRLRECLEKETPVPEAIHKRIGDLFLQYVVVGGMPEAVTTFLDTHDMGQVLAVQRGIVDEYKDDMGKYAPDADKPKIRECFESIPRQLSKENKKFQYATIRKGARASQYLGSLQWIEDAGIIARCYNLTQTELPLDGNADEDVFKVYMRDSGLFLSMLEQGTQADVLQGNLLGYKGAIFENIIADVFSKMGRGLYYFHKDSGLEVDFLMRYKGRCTLVEVKAATGNVKSTRTILKNKDVYHVDSALKLGNYNVGRSGETLTLPLYMAFLLTEY
ncbi:MAG: ATP-binding protein [Bacteroidales bacterium]|nr:ATP-binding protein [Bacteroidales bacterium]